MREYALVLLVTAAVTYLLVPLVRRVAVGTRAIHEPRARDTHTTPTPLLGGLAMYGGLVAGLLIASRLSVLEDPFKTAGSRTEAGLLVAGGFVVVVGFVDDRWGLSAISKLAGQIAAAGILVWSGQALPWLPTPSGGVFPLEPDLSVTLTILIVVVTINAINFIDGLDGLAAGIVAVAALSFLVYTYTLIRTIDTPSQSLPAVASALLAGMCLGFLPHNFYPARIFMGDIGAMLLGLMLAYGPISSTNSLAPALLTQYSAHHALDRFPTLLPLLMPAAIFVIPYADLMFAIIRRTRAGKPIMVADRQHLHHRLLNIGHSYRQSVLLMYLWAALFSVTVVSLSLVRSPSAVFAAATAVAVLALLPVTMPRLRPPWAFNRRKASSSSASAGAAMPGVAMPGVAMPGAATLPPGTRYHASRPSAAETQAQAVLSAAPVNTAPPNAAPTSTSPASTAPASTAPTGPAPGYSLPRPPRRPSAEPFVSPAPFSGQAAFPQFPYPGREPFPDPGPFSGREPFPDQGPFSGREPFPDPGPFQGREPFPDPGPFQGREPFPDPGPFQGREPFPDPGPFPGREPFPDPGPFPDHGPFPAPEPIPGQDPFNDEAPFPGVGPGYGDDPFDRPDPFSQAQPPDMWPS
jgi:UDP-GlcNAc:undecaprenyl-phosphate GlcNAc-1-phosphate transferase